jgi:hypothetical protein
LEHGQGNAPCNDGFADHAVHLLGHRASSGLTFQKSK